MHRQTDGWRMHDGHNAMTIARWPSASGAKNHQDIIQICSTLNHPGEDILFWICIHHANILKNILSLFLQGSVNLKKTLSQTTNSIDSSKLKKFACDKFQIWWKWQRVLQKGKKGEIAHYKGFVIFPVFSKDLYYRHIKTGAGFDIKIFGCQTVGLVTARFCWPWPNVHWPWPIVCIRS